jgi:ABC-2 type transport system ATP-binding protein
LLTTHYMFEADSLCQRVAVIDKGMIVAMDSPSELKKHVADLSVIEIETFGTSNEVVERVRGLAFVDALHVQEHDQRQMLLVQTARGAEAVPDVMESLNGARVGRVIVREPTLEDAYVRLVGGKV